MAVITGLIAQFAQIDLDVSNLDPLETSRAMIVKGLVEIGLGCQVNARFPRKLLKFNLRGNQVHDQICL